MKVLYSTQAVVEFDGKFHYNNAVQASYRKYMNDGDEITVFCYKKKVEKSKSDIVDKNVKFIFAQKVNTVKSIFRGDSKLNEKQAELLVKSADFCVVNLPCAHSYQVIKYAKKFKKPYLSVVVGCPWDALWNFDWRGKMLAPIAFFRLRAVMKHASYSIYVTNIFLQRRYPTKGEYIGCSDLSVATGVEGILDKRKNHIKLIEKEDRLLRIGTAAAVDVPYKGQEYVIRALALLKKEGVMMEYHLIGNGDINRLKEIAETAGVSSQVIFHGAIPHSKVLDFFDDIDVYVQPSKQEGLPRALVEAMSRGCLCVGSRIAGIPELLEPEYLFKKGSVNEIINILRKVTPESLVSQAKRNFDKAKEYDVNVLNNRRTKFISEFRDSFMS